ncbi:FAD-dependent oxidoreductase [Roseibium denhamense]|uniref:Glycine/D-amino acid oxidase n=1 Tax=Roseibium denhamense TaxID=76305 RepID=A0ABY1PNT3_9HYPH|nr:FAD-binding oxidoreductase [Roseibium denhamense]MTI06977.1 FAD-dependent oxidoreductase [Roseibium denhamense]SMP36672.1 Glycine/D-amino acid oxidase [Roseibium denhamense]
MTAEAKPDFPYVQSYWSLDQELEVSPPLNEDHRTEVVVMGAGFAGLASALGLIEARPDLKVTVIEAHHAGYGASGRNSGQIFNLPPFAWFLQNLSNYTHRTNARRAVRLIDDQIAKTFALLAEAGHDFECEKSVLQVVARNAVTAAGAAWVCKRLQKAGVETSFFDGKAAQGRVGSATRAILDVPAYRVHPFKLAQSLRKVLLSRGVSFYEDTPVDHIHSHTGGVTLRGPGYTVEAEKAVMTTNAYTAAHNIDLDFAYPKVTNSHTYMIATEVLSQDVLDKITATGDGFGDAALRFYYGRLHNGRLLFGGEDRKSSVLPEEDRHKASFASLHAEMLRRFPFLDHAEIYAAWGGAFQSNVLEIPQIRRAGVGGNVILNVAYGGNGVSGTLMSGRLMRHLVLHVQDDPDTLAHLQLLADTGVPWAGLVPSGIGLAATFLRRSLGFRY